MAPAVAGRSLLALAAVAASLPPLAAGARVRATPVQQVIQMLAEMQGKAERDLEREKGVFAQYKAWADDRSKELGFEIKTAESKIEELTAFIEKAENKVASLGKAIATLNSDIGRMEQEKKEATQVRESEHAEYVQLQEDYAGSVEALEKAVQTVSAEAYDRPQAEAMLQRMSRTTPGISRVLAAFLQQGSEASGAPAVAAYDFQSDGVAQMLKDLLKQFQTQLQEVEDAEANRAHYHDLEKIHLTDGIARARADMEERSAMRGKTLAASAKAQGELTDVRQELAADQALLQDSTSTFEKKSLAFAANQEVRRGELEALGKALELISSPAVAGSYGEHVTLAQAAAAGPALVQLASGSGQRAAARRRAAALLRRRAGALSSRSLESAAARVEQNPFTKVVQMIEDLLAKLKDEASAEAEHKTWCDEQLKINKLKREKKSTNVKEFSAELEELGIAVQDAGKEINVLIKEQADLNEYMTEATQHRETEKAANLDTIADAQAGAVAVKRALVLLKEFYTAQSSSFLQQSTAQVPELAAYKGMQGENKGVIGMLEVIESDFVRLAARTRAAEEQATELYEKSVAAGKADAELKHKREVELQLSKDGDEFAMSQKRKDLAENQRALNGANTYYEQLKPTCLEVHVSFGERAARRKEEIAALKEAYAMLEQKADA